MSEFLAAAKIDSNTRIPRSLRESVDQVRVLIEELRAAGIRHRDTPILERYAGYKKSCDMVVEKIELDKIQKVYDLSVKQDHSFVAGNALAHNCNLPKGTSVDVVAQTYMRAWELGCKGFTVYVDGSRDGVLLTGDEDCASDRPLEVAYVHAPVRPESLEAKMTRWTVREIDENGKRTSQSWVALVGLLDGTPYEVFAGRARDFRISDDHPFLRIKKSRWSDGSAKYELWNAGERLVTDIIDRFDDPTGGAFTRAVSLSLRHGVPVQYVVEQLLKDRDSDMQSLSRALARALKDYIADGTKASPTKKCDGCGGSNLRYQEGCLSCGDCSWSKCGLA